MKALVLQKPGKASIESIPEPELAPGDVLLRVRMVGLCGSDLNSYRGKNPLIRYPRIPGHEIAATIVEASSLPPGLSVGSHVTMSPYTDCGRCASCLRGRPNACVSNQTLGVQRDGALTEFITMPPEKLYPADLSLKELCLVEPLTVGFHAAARCRVTAADKVVALGCGGVGLGAVAASHFAGATSIAVDIAEEKLAIAQKSRSGPCDQLLSSFAARATSGFDPLSRPRRRHRSHWHSPNVSGRCRRGCLYRTRRLHRLCQGSRRIPNAPFRPKELDILGSRNALPEDFLNVIAMLEQKRFLVNDAIGSIVPLEETPRIFADWSADPSSFTKIMVQIH